MCRTHLASGYAIGTWLAPMVVFSTGCNRTIPCPSSTVKQVPNNIGDTPREFTHLMAKTLSIPRCFLTMGRLLTVTDWDGPGIARAPLRASLVPCFWTGLPFSQGSPARHGGDLRTYRSLIRPIESACELLRESLEHIFGGRVFGVSPLKNLRFAVTGAVQRLARKANDWQYGGVVAWGTPQRSGLHRRGRPSDGCRRGLRSNGS
jgi:hypothetical protein